jgi:uncharacterized membrane protein YphA (DoxX/SURF4 family)
MDYFLLVLRVLTSYLFLSTAFHKMFNYRQHIQIVDNYQIFKRRYTPTFVIFSIFVEITVSISLLVGLFIKWSLAIALFLLLVYTQAVLINLIRGRYDLSCGCGGIVGNDFISYKTIMRNIILMLLILVQFISVSPLFSIEEYTTNPNNFDWKDSLILITLSTVLIAFYVYSKFKNLLKELG